MGSKRSEKSFFKLNHMFLLHLLCILIGLLPFIVTKESSTTTTNHDDQIAEAKAKLLKMIQKETFQLSGFDEYATIPITYPLDICLMEVNNNLYAVCLALEGSKNNTKTMLKVLRKVPGSQYNPLYDYVEVFSYETRSAKNMDCVSMGTDGYISVVNEIKTAHYDDITEGSPIFQLKDDQVKPIQYFVRPHQNRMHFLKYHNELLMWQTFQSDGKSHEKPHCPIMKLSEFSFIEIDHIPCMNAMQVEPFLIEHQIYVAVANYMDEHQNIETHSMIFHYDIDTHKFNLTQKIKTFGAIDIKHVHINDNHFLIIANSYRTYGDTEDSVSTSNAVVFRYEHAKFVPMQIIPFDAEVTQFQPYMGEKNAFVLLVSMNEGATKTYQFNGFQFYETPVTFTGGSLGRGVAKMRTYNMNNSFLVLVVANSEMFSDATNLYRVKFEVKLEYDFSTAFDMFDNWYAGVQEKLRTDRIVETYQEIENLKPPPGFGVMNFANTNVKTIYTETLSSTSIPIDFAKLKKSLQRAEEIISKETVRRPKRLNDSMLQNDLKSAPLDDDLLREQIAMSSTLTVKELTVSGNFYAEKINGHSVNDLLDVDSDLVLDTLAVDNLIIVNNTENFTAIETKLLESDNRVKRDAPLNESEPLILNDIIVEGRVNGMDFNYLVENALRTNVDNQVLEAPVNIRSLRAKSLRTFDGKISNVKIQSIAHNRVDNLLIRQPIRFTKSLQVNRLNVLQRLNQILIEDGKMDILFKRSKRVQVIRGYKEFQSINLLKPIILQGKINITSPVLSKIKPIVTINEDIVLDGDIEFIGNVTIQNLLQVQNMFGRSLRYNVAQLLDDGLRLDEPVIDVPLEFLQPIGIDNVMAGTRINGIPIESLVLGNSNEPQIISAPKIFLSDLNVDGDCDVTEINGVNLQMLNNTMLKRSAKNQIVTGSIQFNRIIANKVRANKIILGKTSMDRFLTYDTDQEINANVTIHGDLIVANGTEVEIDHLFINNTIFGVNLQALLDDSYFNTPNESIVITTDKWFQNITIDELIVEGDFWQIGQTTEEIQKRLDDLKNGLTLQGPIQFNSYFSINNLTVTDSINDIPSSSFGHQWLLSAGAQTFTVPQTFTDVTFNDNIQLYGLLNGYDLPELVADTVSKIDPIPMKNVEFDNVIFKKSLNFGGKLSGIQFPDDLILSQSDSLQNFNEPLTFASNVDIYGTLSIGDKLNGNSLSKMCELLEPSPDASQKLTIKGDVIFNDYLTPEYLNSESFEHMRLTTWFANDQYVNFTSDVQFDTVIFEKPITTTGPVNNIDLQELNARYLSLSQPQTITAPINFKGRVHFKDSLNVDTLSLDGLIKVPNSDITLNITDFDQNVLKNTNDTQYIRALWTVNEMRFLGSLTSTTINGLNLATDVALWDTSTPNIIRAPKRFQSLTIDNLYCQYGCTLQGIDMADWIGNAVMTGLNYTIQGTVYAKNPVISYIEALGLVNNMTFNSQTVLLKSVPQRLNGPITIGNESMGNSLSSLTFDNLLVNFINDKNVSEFFGNLIQKGQHGQIDAGEIFTNIEFMDNLKIDDLHVNSQLNGIDINQIISTIHNGQQYREASNQLDVFVDKLVKRDRFKHFERMVVRQTLPNDLQGLQKLVGYDFEFVAFNTSNIQFYGWNTTQKTLQPSNIPLALPENMVVIGLTALRTDLMHLLVIQMHNMTSGQFVQQFYDYTHDLQKAKLVYEMVQDVETNIEPFDLDMRHCFILYSKFNATQFDVHCMDVIDSESQQLKVHHVESERSSEIYKIISGYVNAIIVWFINGEIESRWYDTQNHQQYTDRRQFDNLTSVAAHKFGDRAFVAVSMHVDAFGRPNHVGSFISIYRIGGNGAQLEHYSDIEFENSIVLHCEFTKLSNVQPILVVAVRSGAEEMVMIYQDKGVNGFQQLKHRGFRTTLSIPSNGHAEFTPKKPFTLIEAENGILSFIAIHTELGIFFNECIYV